MKMILMKSKISVLPLSFLFCAFPGHTQNYYLGFDGVNDYVSLPSNVQPSGSAFTAEAWIYIDPAGGGDQKILMNLTWGGGCKGFGMSIYKEAGGFTYCGALYASGAAYFTPNSPYIPTNTWTHIALAWQANDSLHNYVNGKLIGSTYTGSSSYSNSWVNTYMGSGDGAGWAPFKGKIDEVRIWNAERSSTELINNMNSDLSGAESGIAAYYKMSNGSGTTLSDNKSGGSNNGSLNNGVVWLSGGGLPLHFESFTGKNSGDDNMLYWSTSSEYLNDHFEIQRSHDGLNYDIIGTTPSLGNSSGILEYSYTDHQPVSGNNFYRIRQVDQDGGSIYTGTVLLKYEPVKGPFRIMNNPVMNGTLELVLSCNSPLSLFRQNGTLVFSRDLASGNVSLDVSGLPAGIYLLRAGSWSEKIVIR